ncbi:MAG: nucleotidyltransferase domain-containing protein [Anaerolineae bacterium]|nr:nucleotidyltransferase domain-containing protein [Anaerolineae bacterium]
MVRRNLDHLTVREREALAEFARRLKEQFDGGVPSVLLFGSCARGESRQDSDLDVLVVTRSEDWRVHKQVRYLAADICLEYGVDLSPRVWSVSHYREAQRLNTALYRNIRRDAVPLPGFS